MQLTFIEYSNGLGTVFDVLWMASGVEGTDTGRNTNCPNYRWNATVFYKKKKKRRN